MTARERAFAAELRGKRRCADTRCPDHAVRIAGSSSRLSCFLPLQSLCYTLCLFFLAQDKIGLP